MRTFWRMRMQIKGKMYYLAEQTLRAIISHSPGTDAAAGEKGTRFFAATLNIALAPRCELVTLPGISLE